MLFDMNDNIVLVENFGFKHVSYIQLYIVGVGCFCCGQCLFHVHITKVKYSVCANSCWQNN